METEKLNSIVAIIGALIGGGGVSSVLTLFFSKRKYKAEADALRIKNEQTEMDYIKQSFKELNEETKRQYNEFKESASAEIESLHKQVEDLQNSNKNLEKTVDDLNKRLTSLITWVTVDDQRYRAWLENKIHELDPSIEFPEFIAPPSVVTNDDSPPEDG